MKIAVEGCCHGELDAIYSTVSQLEQQNGFKIDLLLICGDFQSVRNFDDLQAMAVPMKYQQLQTFYKYYSGEKVAPVLTIFIGGNHEASNFLQELPYGGWVAPNIYYMGYAGVVQVGGVRIGGISGIYKGQDFTKGHHERPPYNESTKRSVYHVRNLEVFRLKQLSRDVDIFMSHDWPQGIYHNGNTEDLIRRKPFFKQEIQDDTLGSRPLAQLLCSLKPTYWFAAHLHVKFAAHVLHPDEGKTTRFLALDKCLPRRSFLQVLDIPHKAAEGLKIKLDAEWLTILRNTNHLLRLTPGTTYMPGPGYAERYDFTVQDQDLKETLELFGGDLSLPENFERTAAPIVGNPNPRAPRRPLEILINPQTSLLCTMLDLTDPNAKFLGKSSEELVNESFAGIGEGSGDDVEECGDDSNDFPSYIDSSMDISSSTSLPHLSQKDISPSTPVSRNSPTNAASPQVVAVKPQDVIVDENDEELLSILSAQKKKTPEKVSSSASPLSDPPSCDGDQPTSSCDISSTSDSLSSGKPKSSQISCDHEITNSAGQRCSFTKDSCSHRGQDKVVDSSSSSATSHSGGKLQAITAAQKYLGQTRSSIDSADGLGALSQPELSSVTSGSDKIPPLKKCATSFGMSGLCLDSTASSSDDISSSLRSPSPPNGSNKRVSSSNFETGIVTSTPVHLAQAPKRLKRRNVSMYGQDSQ